MRQLGLYVNHFIADLLPDEIQIVIFITGVGMDDRDARLRIRPDLINLRQCTNLGLKFSGNELLDVLGLHTRKEGSDHHLSDDDGWVLLTRKGKELL